MRSLIRTARLASVFPTRTSRQMHAWFARLCVLMEDLRIEIHCLYDESLSGATQVESDVRRLYFLRRAVATLVEFAEALHLLEREPDFQCLKAQFNSEALTQWSQAVQFFHANEAFLKRVRNDVGGHFGGAAAVYAVENMQPSASGKIELLETKPGEWAERLHFTSLVAATALIRHLPGSSPEEKVDSLVAAVVEATKHATQAVHIITALCLWDRFGPSTDDSAKQP
jgi:hypothetical protein